jgi:hypothetical protein
MVVTVELEPGPVREAVVSFITEYAARSTRLAYANDLTLWARHRRGRSTYVIWLSIIWSVVERSTQ